LERYAGEGTLLIDRLQNGQHEDRYGCAGGPSPCHLPRNRTLLAQEAGFRGLSRHLAFASILIFVFTLPLAACTTTRSLEPSRGSGRPDPGSSSTFYASEMTALQTLKLINYFPARSSWAYMWEDFRPGVIDQDMARMAMLHANGVRIIISTVAFGFPQPNHQDLAELREVIQIAQQHGLRVQLTLFDTFGGWGAIQGSREWARTLLAPYAGDREIAFIELRNEIDPASSVQMTWCRNILPYTQGLARGVPVTVSVTNGVSTLVDLRRQLGRVRPDFWDLHYYGVAGGAYAAFAAARAAVLPDQLYIGEFGFSTWAGNAASVPGLPSSQPELDAYQAYYYASVEAATKALDMPPAAPWTLNDFSRTGTPLQPSPAEYFYGVYRLNGSVKPAAAVISQFFSTGQVNTFFNQDFAQLTGAGHHVLAVLWQLEQPDGGTFTSDPNVAYGGGLSARLSGTGASCPAYSVTPPNGFVRPGQSVSVSVQARGAQASGSSGLSIVWMNMSGEPMNSAGTRLPTVSLGDGTTNWTNLQLSSVAPAGAAYVQIDLVSCANRGMVWFSDVHFSPAPVAAGV
jgi:hypothetical protein